MLRGINIEDVKKYNTSLKQYKDKAASLKAEIDYTSKAIGNLCKELTTELGVTVTRDNLEQIYNEQLDKIESALRSGNAVLSKIASEEVKAAQATQEQQAFTGQTFTGQAVQTEQAPVHPVNMGVVPQVNTQQPGVVTQQPFNGLDGALSASDNLTGPTFTIEDDDEDSTANYGGYIGALPPLFGN